MDVFSTIQCLQVEDNSGVFIFFLIPGKSRETPGGTEHPTGANAVPRRRQPGHLGHG